MKLKTKFILLGALLFLIVAATEWLNWKNEAISNKQELSVEVIQRHLDADMKHDGIRGNVFSALLALKMDDNTLHQESIDEVKTMSGEFADNVDKNIAAGLPEDIKQQFSKIKESVASYTEYSNKIAQENHVDNAMAMLPEFNQLFGVLEEDQGKMTEMLLAWSTQLHNDSENNGNNLNIALVALLVIAIGLPIFAVIAVFKPIEKITSAMQQISGGDTTLDVPYASRKDEVGQMAQALQIFKENGLKIESMNKEQAAQKIENEKQKRDMMHKMADGFEKSIKGIVSTVAAAATELAQTAEGLVATTSQTSRTVQSASTGANQTVANVQSVASAAEEMTASVKEISSQLQNSNIMVQDSVRKAESADAQASSLSDATVKVKEVIALISNIAGQINLLALNATIESARAGEAGKGFAVVASEVKNLAGQTDKSVQEIEKVISEMSGASIGIIDSLKDIRVSIQNISGASGTIAAAVEEQSATTNEIASNMQNAATATEAISGNLNEVATSSAQAESASTQVLLASRELSKHAEELNREVEEFLQTIRSA
jgi:methyl-accepting chemotaxis protein